MHNHELYMQRCIELAGRGAGAVAPNPLVGCVIVHKDEIISEDWHQKFGENHAERNAILKIKDDLRLRESTLYVNLEPCAHHGKTPPCSDLMLEYGIPNIVYGCRDPYFEVDGKGLDMLRQQNANIIGPILEEECMELNRRFLTFHTKKRPYIILKWAETRDGFIAPTSKERTQISGEDARILLHKWRAEEAAVLVGSHTAMHDNPSLNVRFWEGETKMRVFFDGSLKGHHVPGSIRTIIFNQIQNIRDGSTDFIRTKSPDFIPEAIEYFYEHGINSILVEGGRETILRFINLDLYDEIRVIKSKNIVFHHGIPAPLSAPLNMVSHTSLESDEVSVYRNTI